VTTAAICDGFHLYGARLIASRNSRICPELFFLVNEVDAFLKFQICIDHGFVGPEENLVYKVRVY
jgi:hypothetical protein